MNVIRDLIHLAIRKLWGGRQFLSCLLMVLLITPLLAFAQTAKELEKMADHQRLGVLPNSNEVEIKKAYRKLVRKLHPDFLPNLSPDELWQAGEALALVNASYERMMKNLETAEAKKQTSTPDQPQAEKNNSSNEMWEPLGASLKIRPVLARVEKPNLENLDDVQRFHTISRYYVDVTIYEFSKINYLKFPDVAELILVRNAEAFVDSADSSSMTASSLEFLHKLIKELMRYQGLENQVDALIQKTNSLGDLGSAANRLQIKSRSPLSRQSLKYMANLAAKLISENLPIRQRIYRANSHKYKLSTPESLLSDFLEKSDVGEDVIDRQTFANLADGSRYGKSYFKGVLNGLFTEPSGEDEINTCQELF